MKITAEIDGPITPENQKFLEKGVRLGIRGAADVLRSFIRANEDAGVEALADIHEKMPAKMVELIVKTTIEASKHCLHMVENIEPIICTPEEMEKAEAERKLVMEQVRKELEEQMAKTREEKRNAAGSN